MRIKILPLFTSFLLLISCNDFKESEVRNVQDKSESAIEIISDYRLITYKRALDLEKDKDFITPEVKSAMLSGRMYKDKSYTKSDASESSDTLMSSEQIPFCADVREVSNIYQDGSSEFSRKTEMDPDRNPLLGFHEEPVDLKDIVSKVEIKDGMATTYNSSGECLSKKQVQMPDYSEYLEKMSEYRKESESETKSGIRRDIEWLRRRMESSSVTKDGQTFTYRIYETEGDKVVLEQDIMDTKSGENLTVRTFLSSDISKNYGYEQLSDGYLKVRCTHSFSGVTARTKSHGLPAGSISEENPVRTVFEELSYLHDGTPMISVSDKIYRENRINYNLK